jgi:ABC-2 type transport system permease protein
VEALRSLNGRWSGYLGLLAARMKEMQREPEVIFWVFVFPLLLALGLGIAFREKPSGVTNVAIVNSPGAPRVLDLLRTAPQKSTIRAEVLSEAQAFNRFRLGKDAIVVIPEADGSVRYRYDPARPESLLARSQVDEALQASAGRKDPVPTSSEVAMEPGSRYIDFLIPGLLGMNLMNSGMWGIGFALVDMRQRKLLKRYLATPMRRSDFLLAMTSSRLVFMLTEVGLLLGFGVLVFRMRVLGSLAAIVLVGAMGALCFGALGLLSATRAQKIETVSGLINLVMLPMWVFSGVFFSYERFPAVVQPLIKLLPLTALNDALRATILEGAALAAQGPRLLVMTIWAAVSFILAAKWFRWQ